MINSVKKGFFLVNFEETLDSILKNRNYFLLDYFDLKIDSGNITLLKLLKNRCFDKAYKRIMNNKNISDYFIYGKRNELYYCLKYGHFDLAKLLIENGFEINTKFKKKNNALIYCLNKDYSDMAIYLIEKGFNRSR